MKGFYWNSRVLSDLAKYRYISDVIRDRNLDFAAVMETGNKICLDQILTPSPEVQILPGIVSLQGTVGRNSFGNQCNGP